MKDNKNKVQKPVLKTLRTVRNVFSNGFKEVFSNLKFDKIKKIVDENKSLIITSTIITLFIAKNFYTIYSYDVEIKQANIEIEKQKAINNQLKEDLEYYNTDEFILRYSLEELNLRPTKELDIYHGEIIQTKDEEETSDEATGTESDKQEDSNNESSNEESETSLENEEQSGNLVEQENGEPPIETAQP